MQKTKEKGKGKGKGKGKRKRKRSGWQWKWRRLGVSCSPLFTCNVNSGECKRRRRRGRGRGRRREVETVEVGGELRELLFTVHYSLLCLYSSSSAPLFTVSINTVYNSAQKAAWSCFWLSCGLTVDGHGSHKQ